MKPLWRVYQWSTTEGTFWERFVGEEWQFTNWSEAIGFIAGMHRGYDVSIIIYNVYNHNVGEMHYNHFVEVAFNWQESAARRETYYEVYQIYVEEVPEDGTK